MKKLAWTLCVVAVTGCETIKKNKFDVDPLRNDKRYVALTRHRDNEDDYGRPQVHACLEPTGAAVTLNKLNVALTGKGTSGAATGEGTLAVDNAQSVGQLYAVSEIMQLAHAGLYRLCEARSNFDITPEQYAPLYQDALRTTAVLMCVQARLNKDQRLAQKEAEVALLKAEREKLEGEVQKKKKEEAEAKLALSSLPDEKSRPAVSRFLKSLEHSPGGALAELQVEAAGKAAPNLAPYMSAASALTAERARIEEKLEDTTRNLERATAEKETVAKEGDTCDRMLAMLGNRLELEKYTLRLPGTAAKKTGATLADPAPQQPGSPKHANTSQ